MTLYSLSTTSNFLDDLDAGEAYAISAREMFVELGLRDAVGGTYMAQGHSEWWRGNHASALALYETALVEARLAEQDVLAATVLIGVAALEHLLGNHERALESIVQAAEEAMELDNAHSAVWALDVLAAIAVDLAPEPAVALAGAADALRQEAGGGWTSPSRWPRRVTCTRRWLTPTRSSSPPTWSGPTDSPTSRRSRNRAPTTPKSPPSKKVWADGA